MRGFSRVLFLVLAGAAASAGCGNEFELDSAAASGDEQGTPDGGVCAKIEGEEIGVEDVTLVVAGKVVRFHSWIAKEGEPGEFLGFSWESDGAVAVRVKAGGETYPATDGGWMHPNAATDGSASAVSNVEACDPDAPDDGDGNDDDGGNPDDSPDSPDGDDPDGDPDDT